MTGRYSYEILQKLYKAAPAIAVALKQHCTETKAEIGGARLALWLQHYDKFRKAEETLMSYKENRSRDQLFQLAEEQLRHRRNVLALNQHLVGGPRPCLCV